jgi:hypothetical protein
MQTFLGACSNANRREFLSYIFLTMKAFAFTIFTHPFGSTSYAQEVAPSQDKVENQPFSDEKNEGRPVNEETFNQAVGELVKKTAQIYEKEGRKLTPEQMKNLEQEIRRAVAAAVQEKGYTAPAPPKGLRFIN